MADFISWKPPLWTAGLNFDTINGGIVSAWIGTFRPKQERPETSDVDRDDPTADERLKEERT